ncbi:unnamed protein product [Mycena citricolor]|uniref:Metallo-beta-lactamase domain-containing protein n=1 Tax=Mycena citricolor TaxID=2018698 RepID=A0AAD2GSD8_9AGAR|nr:unnamed protein product [Mycena citricolor]
MDKLQVLAPVTRNLGPEPGEIHIAGYDGPAQCKPSGPINSPRTNTYLVGKQRPFTLLDVGEGRDEYTALLEAIIRRAGISESSEPDISDIIISHWHEDHVGGLPKVLALLERLWHERHGTLSFKPPRLHKFPTQTCPQYSKLPAILSSLPPNSFVTAPDGSHFHDLRDGDVLSGLHVLHTPGHTVDSMCLYFPQDGAFYTADTVLGQGTAVFEDLATYIGSLRRMLDYVNERKAFTLYPGHGPVIYDGPKVIETYIKHRMDREAQILGIIGARPGDNTPWTTWSIVAQIYAAYPESLWLPASRGIDLHMRKLEGEGVVQRLDGEGKDAVWVLA